MLSHELEALVKSIVNGLLKDYSDYNLDKDDLISEGYLIATEQMSNFKVTKGASLRTYLYSQIAGRLRNYVNRQMLKASHGNEQMRRVSMENVDAEVYYEDDRETKMALDDFRLSLETEEAKVFDYMRCGYTFREISAALGVSTGSLSNMVKRWHHKGVMTI